MERERRGGLSGRARQTCKLKRAARVRGNQHVDDYYDPDPLARVRERSIPIRGRSDFFPSAEQPIETATAQTATHQLELPLAPAGQANNVAQDQREASLKPTAIRFPKRSEGEGLATLRPPMHYRRKGGFTWKGFLVGCAMGSAAAAFVLMVLQTAIN